MAIDICNEIKTDGEERVEQINEIGKSGRVCLNKEVNLEIQGLNNGE